MAVVGEMMLVPSLTPLVHAGVHDIYPDLGPSSGGTQIVLQVIHY